MAEQNENKSSVPNELTCNVSIPAWFDPGCNSDFITALEYSLVDYNIGDLKNSPTHEISKITQQKPKNLIKGTGLLDKSYFQQK